MELVSSRKVLQTTRETSLVRLFLFHRVDEDDIVDRNLLTKCHKSRCKFTIVLQESLSLALGIHGQVETGWCGHCFPSWESARPNGRLSHFPYTMMLHPLNSQYIMSSCTPDASYALCALKSFLLGSYGGKFIRSFAPSVLSDATR